MAERQHALLQSSIPRQINTAQEKLGTTSQKLQPNFSLYTFFSFAYVLTD